MEVVCQGEYIKFLHIITHGEVGVVDRIEGDRVQFFQTIHLTIFWSVFEHIGISWSLTPICRTSCGHKNMRISRKTDAHIKIILL